MVSYINLFLKTEVTCIPKILTKYFGDYYNNAVCNGATWVFVLWGLLHGIFDKLLEAMLKKLRYREFVRSRLKSSLWYLGFYGTGLIYCGATLSQNEVELFNFKKMHVPSNSNLPTQLILGYTLICTFYLHSAFWEGLTKGLLLNMLKYLALFMLLISSYILRIVEVSFTFTAVISVGQVALEITRCLFMSSTQDTFLAKFFATSVYMVAFATYLSVYLIVVPLTFIIPFGLKIMSDYPNMLLMFLFLNLLLWMGTEMYQSVLLRFVNHWLYHKEEKDKSHGSTEILNDFPHIPKCDMSLLECSLFKPRDDIAYNIRQLRKEMQERKSRMMAMRKPKNMFYQTLKCMVAVKRKLSEKRIFESLKSENTEDDPIINSDENENNDDGEGTGSEHEEESEDDTSDNLDNNNWELERPHLSRKEECGNIQEDQNNSCQCSSDSESEIRNLESSNFLEPSDTDDECKANCSESKKVLEN